MSMTDRIAALEPDTFMSSSWKQGYREAIEDVLELMANDTVPQPMCICSVYGNNDCSIHGTN